MKRAKYSLSHYKLVSSDMGELIPIGCIDVLPGDTFQHSTSLLMRVSPLVNPVMHPVQVRVHHWYVPYRLLWVGWESFITGGSDGVGDGVIYPTQTGAFAAGALYDYLGVRPGATITVGAMPARAYTRIWNDFYRDQDIDVKRAESTAGGDDTDTQVTLAKIRWGKDYFTTARPWPQRGPAATVPIATNALGIQVRLASDPTVDRNLQTVGATTNVGVSGAAPAGTTQLQFGTQEGLLNLTVADLRESFALQRFAEARALYGARYTEYLRYIGVSSSDSRLQRPEYLGGGKQTISFSEVLRTEGATTTGEMAGHGISATRTRPYRRFFEEHGVVMSLMSVRPLGMYTEALDRMWSKRTREDYYQHELVALGPQELFRREIFSEADPAGATVFGYQDRYEEYRRHFNGVTGEFRTTTLNDWHLARSFAVAPALNSTFVECTPTKRIHAVQTNDVLWTMVYHNIRARRLVSRNSGIGRVL